ncbi:MAG TPA: SIS domain-containing protein [Vicinamibacteria bacterium]|nr:SIS domain-containing protein [Vicinamibacteria bacterium]
MSLESEIREQPEALARLLDRQSAAVRAMGRAFRERAVEFILLAARGTSDNAGLYAAYLWGAYNSMPVALAAPSLFTSYARPPRLDHALVVAVSQSGQSPDIVAVLDEARRQGAPTLAIVNDPGSPLARAADQVVDICAGPEKAVAATKSYTAQLTAIAMLSTAVADDEQRWRELARVPELVGQALALDERIAERAERYRFMEHCVVLGRGFNLSTANEWALKLKELAYVIAEPYSSADFQHGPVAMLERGFPVLGVAPEGAVFDDTRELLARLVGDKHVELLVMSDRDEALSLAHTPLRLPSAPEWVTPIVSIVAGQLFCYHLTRAKGYDTESPRGLRKVTLTR